MTAERVLWPAFRPLLRGLVDRLPATWQLRVRAAKRVVLRQYDWARPIARLRRRDDAYIDATRRQSQSLPGRQRVAIYSLHHFSPVEYSLAMALQLRGHEVQGILCDGLLPLCELSLGPNVRPPCDACVMNLSRYESAFGFHYERLSRFLTEDDRARATALVAAVPPAARLSMTVNGVAVGRLAHRELQRYYRGFVFEPSADPAFQKWLVSAVLLTWLSERWLDSIRPDIVGTCSGRTLPTACVFEVARRKGIRTVTWDGVATRPDALMFSHDRPATEVPLDEAWLQVAGEPLSPQQDRELDAFLADWSRSRNTPFPYNPHPVDNEAVIRAELGLRDDAPLVAAFSNTSWDISVIDRDAGFDSMFDWLFALVGYAARHPEIDLVVRAHPAEKTVPPELQSRTPVGAEIRKRCHPLPRNVKIVEGDNPISSYRLAGMAQVNIVYASRLGLELAVAGMRAWIAGVVTYRGKGFTLDLESREHMFDMLDLHMGENRLSGEDIERARRFAYLWFFRYEVRLPLLHPADKRFALDGFRQLGPGGDPVLENVCHAVVTGVPFLDLNAPVA